MSITDELRGWYSERVFMANGWHELDAIADRIDAEHEKECSKAWMRGHDVWASVGNENVMAERGWVRLPVDADGVPIHYGDKLRFDNGMIVEVRYLKIDSEGTSVCVLATNGGGDFYAITDKAHHYHALTVEDVLREFTDAILDWAGKSGPVAETGTWSDVAAEFAKRLTLAGDAE